MSNSKEEKETETLVTIVNKLFDSVFDSPITLNSLTNEVVLKELILDIEPDIEHLIGKLNIVKDDTFPMRYSNLVLIVKGIDSYFEKCYEKSKIFSRVPVKKLILINDLLKGEEYQILSLIEILILMSATSSKKDYFLDKIGECEERLINTYLSYVEKYIPLETRNDCNESLININTSIIRYNNGENSNKILGVLNEKLNKKIEENEKEKANLLKAINDYENKIREEKNKNSNLEMRISELENKQKDFLREIEMSRSNDNMNKMQQEMMEESMLISQLRSDLKSKELELEDKNREIIHQKKLQSEEIARLQEKLDNMHEKVISSKDQGSEIEKLRTKVKELQVFRDKQSDFDEIVMSLESKTRMVDNLVQEKQAINSQLEKYSKEILNEKDKVRKKEYELKQVNYDLQEIKKENARLESLLKIKNQSGGLDHSKLEKDKVPQINLNLGDIEQSLFSDEKDTYDKIGILEREILELKADKAKLKQDYKLTMDENLKVSEENESLKARIEEFERELKYLKSEKEKYDIEKEKIDLKNQKFDIEIQKKTLSVEKLEIDKRKLEADVKELKDKINKIQGERQNLIKEYEKNIEKLTKEKSSLSNEISSNNKEIEKIKSQYEGQSK